MAIFALSAFFLGFPIQPDKAAHFGSSYALNDSIQAICERLSTPVLKDDDIRVPCQLIAASLTVSIGLAWESHGNQDWKDFAFNLAGISASQAIITLRY